MWYVCVGCYVRRMYLSDDEVKLFGLCDKSYSSKFDIIFTLRKFFMKVKRDVN